MKSNKIFSNLYIFIILLILYLPILCVVVYSFNVSRSSAVWTGFTLDWYIKMLNDRRLTDALWVSIKVAVGASLVSAVFGTMSAIAVAKLNPKLQELFNSFFFIPLIIPEIILAIALLMFFSYIPSITYGIYTLIVSHTVFCIPYIFLLVSIRLNTIEKSILEAAKDLGGKDIYVFRTITFPLILPAIVTGSLLSLAMSLDDVVISFFLSGVNSTTLPLKIYSMLKLGVTPEINALCTIILLVTFLVIGILQALNLKRV